MTQKPTYEELERRIQELETDYRQLEKKLVKTDIAERKQIEEKIRFFRIIAEQINDSLIVTDTHFAITYINQATEHLFGYTLDEVRGKTPGFLNAAPGADDLQQKLYETVSSGKIFAAASLNRRKDGSTFVCDYKVMPFKDEQDRIVSYVGVQRDVTESRRAEAQLRLQSLVLDQIEDCVTVTDLNGIITYVNDAEVRALGHSRDDLIGATIDKYGEDSKRGATQRQIIEKTLENGAWRGEVVNKTVRGEDVILDCRTRVVFDEQGNKMALAGISTDITDLKKMEARLRQAEKMESVGRLAGGVAHDFNNMLGVILGHTELALLQADETHALHADLKEIQAAANRSADVTKQLLAFARKQTISPRTLDLNDTVASMLNILGRLIGEDIDLVWQPGAHLWPVKMDPTQIDQILANLCVNAMDAIAGVGKLTIETGKTTFDKAYCNDHPGFIPGDFVLLAVSDNGCGMDKDTLANLFEPFFTTKDVGKGTGLGLATIYGIVKQNSGFINVYSEPGQGSTFKIYLPRLVSDEDAGTIVSEKKAGSGGTETILLVEDESTILRMIRKMLERKGYRVLPAATPAEAMDLARIHAHHIHLLMTDVIMPKMNGRDLAGKIQALCPEIKLLFMSGYPANVIAHQGMLDEGVAFIQKPFLLADMTEKVREVLDKT